MRILRPRSSVFIELLCLKGSTVCLQNMLSMFLFGFAASGLSHFKFET